MMHKKENPSMFKKILIANRGEIACRIIRTLDKMGIQSVAIYSSADRFSPHVKLAKEAYCVGAPPPLESYLNISNILNIAKKAQVDAIHPGYGFLSENPEFALACEAQHIHFIGPSSYSMECVGSKQKAKEMLQNSNVPLIPGFNPPNPNDAELLQAAKKIGWPVVLKAAHGGGGKGLKIIHEEKEFSHAIQSARREAKSYFNNDELLLEKLIIEPRHLEVQILADHHGKTLHLFERDCSVQRRQQKIIEEAPAMELSESIRQQLYSYAIQVAETFNYTNAGTVEFLLENNKNLYFMEMNARLQVEHPITEMITGIDLVEWQIRIAQGEKLSIEQPTTPIGHAIECRICAEQPEHDFRPSQGKISYLKWPTVTVDKQTRIDTGIEDQQAIEGHYDSLLAKTIYWAEDRPKAILGMQNMLNHSIILGLDTNLAYLRQLLMEPRWLIGAVPIDYLAKLQLKTHKKTDIELAPIVAVMDSILFWKKPNQLPIDLTHLSITTPRFSPKKYQIGDTELEFFIHYEKPGKLKLLLKTNEHVVDIDYVFDTPIAYIDDQHSKANYIFEFLVNEFLIHDQTCSYSIKINTNTFMHDKTKVHSKEITSPMPATVVAILKNNGDSILQGEPLIVLEAMKMEHTIYAPYDGTIKQFYYQLGQQVQEGQQLLELAENSESL